MIESISTFQSFVEAINICDILESFEILKKSAPQGEELSTFGFLKGLDYHVANELYKLLEAKKSHEDYASSPCTGKKVLVIGGGPGGLRSAIEAALLGAEVMLIEQRPNFTRNNLLLIWDFTMNDLKQLGAKIFAKKLGAGCIHHISIKHLQAFLLKIALILGVKFVTGVSYKNLKNPENGTSLWKAEVEPSHPEVDNFEFDILIASDGEHSKVINEVGFDTKSLHFGTSIGITANFEFKNTAEEKQLDEFSYIRYANMPLFNALKDNYDIELENLVYFRGETHYFVMTPKKESLLRKGVFIEEKGDLESLCDRSNVDKEQLKKFAREIADYIHLPQEVGFELNGHEEEDVTVFDFTKKHKCLQSAKIIEQGNKKLLVAVVGDALLAPFWPQGTGANKALLSAQDAALLMKSFATEDTESVLKHSEECFKMLQNAAHDNMKQNNNGQATLDPKSRYNNSVAHFGMN